MTKINRKFRYLILTALIFASFFGFAKIGERIINVKAQLDDLVVLPLTINYGNVFPEEILDKDFTVSLSDSAIADEKVITYKVEENQISDNNLCEFLTTQNAEDEGDTMIKSSLDPIDRDDLWGIELDVPCIEGYLPQGEECKTIPKEDDYDCEIVITTTSAIAAAKIELPPSKVSKVLGIATGSPVLITLLISFLLTLTFYFIGHKTNKIKKDDSENRQIFKNK